MALPTRAATENQTFRTTPFELIDHPSVLTGLKAISWVSTTTKQPGRGVESLCPTCNLKQTKNAYDFHVISMSKCCKRCINTPFRNNPSYHSFFSAQHKVLRPCLWDHPVYAVRWGQSQTVSKVSRSQRFNSSWPSKPCHTRM